VEVIGTTADGQSPSGLSAETRGSGDAGNLTVETRQLIIREGGTVTTETFGKGKGGELTVNASELVEVAGGAPDASFSSGLSVETEGSGNAGSLGITTRRLVAQDGGFVGASAREGSKGNAGSITINATDSVEVIGMTTDKDFRSGISTAVEANTEGNGGDLTIQTQRLSVRDGASVSVATYGEGDAGKLQINAIESVEVIGGTPANSFSTLNAIVGSDSTGQGGDLTINAQRLSVRDGSGVSVATFGKGNAGTLRVHATESIEVMGTFADSQLHSELSAAVGQNSTGNGGNLSIQTRQLTIQDGAEISASTASSGQGGTLSVTASESVTLSNRGSLSAQATANGNAGSLTINTLALTVEDRAEVTVSSPQGQAGNLTAIANSVFLDQGNLTAVTGKGQGEGGANITLQVQDLLRMHNESQISADALATANGGNINIDTDFLIALPPVGPNGSDIRANAFQGNGGRLNITAQGIFSIKFRSSQTPLNDITASSDFGSAGVVTLNTPDVDPSRGLVNLPTDVLDASGLIAQTCPARGTASEQSEFIITGRGGLPPNPGDTLSSETVLADWATLDTKVGNRSGAQETATKPTKENAPTTIVEATGWAIAPNGEVSLIASAPGLTFTVPRCYQLPAATEAAMLSGRRDRARTITTSFAWCVGTKQAGEYASCTFTPYRAFRALL
jgi:large exoprotein involved in heme utilization and adhesion